MCVITVAFWYIAVLCLYFQIFGVTPWFCVFIVIAVVDMWVSAEVVVDVGIREVLRVVSCVEQFP